MKLVIAQMKHETNTYSPVPTPIGRFSSLGPLPPEGEEAIRAYRGTGSALGAFLQLAEEAGAVDELLSKEPTSVFHFDVDQAEGNVALDAVPGCPQGLCNGGKSKAISIVCPT